jgi:non-specific serine/threonine protein kinase
MLMWAGAVWLLQGDLVRARSELEESLELWQSLGSRKRIPLALNLLGSVILRLGDYERATRLYEAGLAAAREVGDKGTVGLSLLNLGRTAAHQGEVERAVSLFEESAEIFDAIGDTRRLAATLMRRARAATDQADLDRAVALYRAGLELAKRAGTRYSIAYGLLGLASVAVARGHPVCAARLLGAADALRDAIGAHLLATERAKHDGVLGAARADLGEAAYAAAWAEGQAMLPEQAIAYARRVASSLLSTTAAARESSADEQVLALTPRQRQVAALVARGMTNREIAAELVIAEGTAANHVAHILARLVLHSREQIAAWADEHGLHGD